MPAHVLVCVCDTFFLSQPHWEPLQSLQSTYHFQVQPCKHMHGFNLRYGNREDICTIQKYISLWYKCGHYSLILSPASIHSAAKGWVEEHDAAWALPHHQWEQTDSSSKAHRGFIILLTGNFLPAECIRDSWKTFLSGFNEVVSLLAARNEPGSGTGLLLCVSLWAPRSWKPGETLYYPPIMSGVLTCLVWPPGMLFITVFFHWPVVGPSPRHFAHH